MCCTLAAVTSGYVQKNQALIQKRSCIYQKNIWAYKNEDNSEIKFNKAGSVDDRGMEGEQL